MREAWLPVGFPEQVRPAIYQLRLGSTACAVTDMAFQPVSHDELADGALIDAVRLAFLSPAYFSRNGDRVAGPDPRLIVGSWRRRWNASLPAGDSLQVPDALWRDIHLLP